MSDSLLHRLAARIFGREADVDPALVADLAAERDRAPESQVDAPAFERIESNATERAWFRPEEPPGRDPVDSCPDTSRWWRRPPLAAVQARSRATDDGSDPEAA